MRVPLRTARIRLLACAGTTVAALASAIFIGDFYDAQTAASILGICSLGLGLPLSFVAWMDFARAPRPAGQQRSTAVVASRLGIRLFGLLTIAIGATLLVWIAAALMFPPPNPAPFYRALLSAGVAVAFILFGARWARTSL